MRAPLFRRLVFQTQSQPVRIQLYAGDPIVVRHLDFVHMVGDFVAAWVGGVPRVFQTNAVVSVDYLRPANGRARRA